MGKTIVEQENHIESMILLRNEQNIVFVRPESITKINIHIKTGLLSIMCNDKTEHVVNYEGCDNRIINLLVDRGILTVDNNDTTDGRRLDTSTKRTETEE